MTTAPDEKRAFWRTPSGLAVCVFLAMAALYLILEHRAHILGSWSLLLLLGCVFMHLFMHRSHDGHGSSGSCGGKHSDPEDRRVDHEQ